MDVAMLWFQCKDKDCNFTPIKTKKQKTKIWKQGKSIHEGVRGRMFMRYVEGYYTRKYNGDVLYFECKYGSILMYDGHETEHKNANSWIFPIENVETCNPCKDRVNNEGLLFQ